jgi:protein ImuB
MTERRRIACLRVSDLILAAELRADPELAGAPLAVTSHPGSGPRRAQTGHSEIVAVSFEAAAFGVRPGQTLAHARAACAELVVRVASSALEHTARASLLDVALSLSPRAELAPRAAAPFATEAAVFVDAGGTAALFQSEAGFASALASRAATLGMAGAVAIASSRACALVTARCLAGDAGPGAIRVLPPDAEAAFLADLPVDLLAPDDDLAIRLTRFGVRTVRDLLALPKRSLAKRLGPEALQLVARARGEEIEAPLSEPAQRHTEESVDLEYPIDLAEPLLFALSALLSRLIERLALRSLSASSLELEFQLEGGGRDARRVGGATPTRDLRVWLRLLALELETHPPLAPVEAIRVSSEGCPERRDQLDLFLPRGPSPGDLDRTLAELEALCGSEQVGTPQVADTHRPDAFGLVPFELPGPANAPRETSDTPIPTERVCRPALRSLRPPARAEVRVEAGAPVAIRSSVTSGHIVHASGPWRSTGRWWSEEDRFALDHFDVQVSDGTVARLCFDWIERYWSVDAIYD